MNSKDKVRLEELEAEECLVDEEDVIDYYRLSCEKLEEENQELKDKVNHYKNKFYTTHKSAESIKNDIRIFLNDLYFNRVFANVEYGNISIKETFNKVTYMLEELEKENEDLRIENAEAFHKLAIQDYLLGKFKVAIQQAIELLSIDGQGTKQEVKKLLSEVLGE